MRYANTDNDLANVGFQNFKFNAADVVIRGICRPLFADRQMYGLNTAYIEWYFSQVDLFPVRWSGSRSEQLDDVSGQFLVGSNLMVPSPRTGFKLKSSLFSE